MPGAFGIRRVDIVLPIYSGNLLQIPESIRLQLEFFTRTLVDYDWRIVLAINGPRAESVLELAKRLKSESPRCDYVYTEEAGKGAGVLYAWSHSSADIMSYMDIDLATELEGFPRLIAALEKGADIAIGSRFHPESVTNRSLKRRIVSHVYHRVFMKIFLRSKSYTDGQCGFKAINPIIQRRVLPLIENRNWFFESEMLYWTEQLGYQITEVPVKWKESEHSGLTLPKAIWEFIHSAIALQFRPVGPLLTGAPR